MLICVAAMPRGVHWISTYSVTALYIPSWRRRHSSGCGRERE